MRNSATRVARYGIVLGAALIVLAVGFALLNTSRIHAGSVPDPSENLLSSGFGHRMRLAVPEPPIQISLAKPRRLIHERRGRHEERQGELRKEVRGEEPKTAAPKPPNAHPPDERWINGEPKDNHDSGDEDDSGGE